jgi:hypothetical protein
MANKQISMSFSENFWNEGGWPNNNTRVDSSLAQKQ